jgi:hypothetical protein
MVEFNLEDYIIKVLRRAVPRSPQGQQAKMHSRIVYGKYKCPICGKIGGPRKFELDHVLPIVSVDNKDNDLLSKIYRVFCSTEGLQYICKSDHRLKSKKENELRRINAKKAPSSTE